VWLSERFNRTQDGITLLSLINDYLPVIGFLYRVNLLATVKSTSLRDEVLIRNLDYSNPG
jgi:hypothetical protein